MCELTELPNRILDEWWNGSNQMRRRLRLPVLLFVCILAIGPNEGRVTQALFIVAPLLLVWWGWPELRTMLHRRRRKLSVVLWIRRFHRGPQSQQLFVYGKYLQRYGGRSLQDNSAPLPHGILL